MMVHGMNRIRLIIVIGLLLGCMSSIVIGCASTTRLPATINIVPPSPDLPLELAAFSGIWKGKWEGYHETILIVENINIKKARVILSFGLLPGYEPRYFYRTFQIIDGPALRIIYDNGDQMILTLNKSFNEIQGLHIEKKTGAKTRGALYKQDTI